MGTEVGLLIQSFALLSFIALTSAACNRNYLLELHNSNLKFFEEGKCRYDGSGAAQGLCKGTLRCRVGHFSSVADEAVLECLNNEWKQSVQLNCQPGCREFDFSNATIVGGGTMPGKFWPQGHLVKTKCKPGFFFKSEKKRSSDTDQHRCLGEGNGWENMVDKSDLGSWPAQCSRFCQLPEGIKFKVAPQKCNMFSREGKSYLNFDSFFEVDGPNPKQIQCSDGYLLNSLRDRQPELPAAGLPVTNSLPTMPTLPPFAPTLQPIPYNPAIPAIPAPNGSLMPNPQNTVYGLPNNGNPNGPNYPAPIPAISLPNGNVDFQQIDPNNVNVPQLPEEIRQKMQQQLDDQIQKAIGNRTDGDYQIVQSQTIEELPNIDGIDLSNVPDLPAGLQNSQQSGPQSQSGFNLTQQATGSQPSPQQGQGIVFRNPQMSEIGGQISGGNIIYQNPSIDYPAAEPARPSLINSPNSEQPHIHQNPSAEGFVPFGFPSDVNNGVGVNGEFSDIIYQNPTTEQFPGGYEEIDYEEFPQSPRRYPYGNEGQQKFPNGQIAEIDENWDYEDSRGFANGYPDDFEGADYMTDDFADLHYSPNPHRHYPGGRLSQIFFGRQPCDRQRSPNTIVLQNPSGPIVFGFQSLINVDSKPNGFGRIRGSGLRLPFRSFGRGGDYGQRFAFPGCRVEESVQIEALSTSGCQIRQNLVPDGCRVRAKCPQGAVLNAANGNNAAEVSCNRSGWHSDEGGVQVRALGCRKVCQLDLPAEVATEYSRQKCRGAENGIFIAGCQIRLQCRNGFVPKNQNRQMEIIKCSADSKWLNSSGQIAEKYLECRRLNPEDLTPYGYQPVAGNSQPNQNEGNRNNGFPRSQTAPSTSWGSGPEAILPDSATTHSGYGGHWGTQSSSGDNWGDQSQSETQRGDGIQQTFGHNGETITNGRNHGRDYNYTIIDTEYGIPRRFGGGQIIWTNGNNGESIQNGGELWKDGSIETANGHTWEHSSGNGIHNGETISHVGDQSSGTITESGSGGDGMLVHNGHRGIQSQTSGQWGNTAETQNGSGNIQTNGHGTASETSGTENQRGHSQTQSSGQNGAHGNGMGETKSHDQTQNSKGDRTNEEWKHSNGKFGTNGIVGNSGSRSKTDQIGSSEFWRNFTESHDQQNSNQSWRSGFGGSQQINPHNGGAVEIAARTSLSPPTTTTAPHMTCRPLDLIDGRAIDISTVNCYAEKDYHYSPGCDLAVLCVYGWLPLNPEVERIPLKCDGASGQIRNLNGAVFKDSDFGCRQVFVAGCQAIAQKEGVLVEFEGNTTVDTTPSLIDGSLHSGVRAKVHCADGFFPDMERYQRTGFQNLTCGADYQWREADTGDVVDQTLVCAKGCIARPTLPPTNMEEEQTINKKFKIDKLLIVCEKRMSNHDSEVEFAGPDRPYYCKAGQKPKASGSETRSIPCTNACRSLADDPDTESISVNQTAIKKKIRFDRITYVPDGHIYTFSCKKPGEVFPLQSRSTMRLQCVGKDRNYMDLDTKEQHFKIDPRCESPKKKENAQTNQLAAAASLLGKGAPV